MGKELSKQNPPSTKAIEKQKAKIDKLENDLSMEMAQIAADAAGLVDPTPTSDAISASISVARGDWWGAALSVVSMIPYAGDAIAKPVKAVRASKSVARIRKSLTAAKKALEKLERQALNARKKAATAIRKKRRIGKNSTKAAQNKVTQNCNYNRFGTRLPNDGKWSGEIGNSKWTPEPGTKRANIVNKYTNGKPIEFKNGYPDFSPYLHKHKGKPASVDIEMQGYITKTSKSGRTYKANPDGPNADKAMKVRDPGWELPDGYTWHHNQNGKTMEAVPSDLHSSITVPHTGGGSIVGDPGF